MNGQPSTAQPYWPRWKRWLLVRLLGQFHDALSAQGKIAVADDVLDVMDAVTGWTVPSRRLT